ncbi:hypothetical protein MTO96_050275 [Rhipicephalus appendiculatus]
MHNAVMFCPTGALLTGDDDALAESALRYAVDRVNTDPVLLPEAKLSLQVERLDEHAGTLQAYRKGERAFIPRYTGYVKGIVKQREKKARLRENYSTVLVGLTAEELYEFRVSVRGAGDGEPPATFGIT